MYICYCPLRDLNWNKIYCIVLYISFRAKIDTCWHRQQGPITIIAWNDTNLNICGEGKERSLGRFMQWFFLPLWLWVNFENGLFQIRFSLCLLISVFILQHHSFIQIRTSLSPANYCNVLQENVYVCVYLYYYNILIFFFQSNESPVDVVTFLRSVRSTKVINLNTEVWFEKFSMQ